MQRKSSWASGSSTAHLGLLKSHDHRSESRAPERYLEKKLPSEGIQKKPLGFPSRIQVSWCRSCSRRSTRSNITKPPKTHAAVTAKTGKMTITTFAPSGQASLGAEQLSLPHAAFRGRDLGHGDGNGRQTIVVTITCQVWTALKRAIDDWSLAIGYL